MVRFLVLILALLFAPFALAQEEVDPAPQGTIAVGDEAVPDAEIAERLRDIIAEIGGYGDVTVTVNEGVVTLRGETASLAEAEDLTPIANRVDGVVRVRNEVSQTTDLTRQLNPAMERLLDRLEQVWVFLPLLVVAVVVFLLVAFLGFLVARMRYPWDRLAPNAFIAEIYRQLVRLAFLVIGMVIALDIMNATALLSTVLGAAGLIGLAIGFAVRDTVENFIASVMLSIRQPFRPNDVVEIEGDIGKVIRLTSRATILLSLDGNHIRIPNATVFKSRIVNYTRNPERRFSFEIGVASDADLSAVRHLAEEVVGGLPFVIAEPAPLVWIDRIGDGAIFLTVTGWIDQRNTNLVAAKGEALRQVKAAIEAAGVEVPDTTYRIDILGGGRAVVTADDDGDGPAAPPARPEPALPAADAVEDVSDTQDDALDRLVNVERDDKEKPDLLRDDAPEE